MSTPSGTLTLILAQVVLGRALDRRRSPTACGAWRGSRSPASRPGTARSASRGPWPPRPRCPGRPRGRRARRRPDPCPPGGRRRASSPRRARRRGPCCPGRAVAPAWRSASRCRADAARSTARRGCRGRRPARSRSGWPAGSAGPRRPTASRPRAPSTGSPTPTLSRNCRRSSISRRISRAIRRSCSDSSSSAHPLQRPARRQRRELVDRRVGDQHRPRLGPQPGALAVRARPQRHVLLDLLAREVRVGLAIAALEVGNDPLELGRVGAPAPEPVAVGDLDAVAVGAVQEEVARLVGQVLPRGLEVDLVALGDRLGQLVVVVGGADRPRARSRPRRSRASDRGPPARDRSPSASPGRCTAGRRRGGS